MQRYRLTADGDHAVHCHYRHGDRAGQTVTFWAPSTGGYVREVTPERPGTLGAQVMDHWLGNGSTLVWGGPDRGQPFIECVRFNVRRELDAYRKATE